MKFNLAQLQQSDDQPFGRETRSLVSSFASSHPAGFELDRIRQSAMAASGAMQYDAAENDPAMHAVSYLLWCSAASVDLDGGRWNFRLQRDDQTDAFEADDFDIGDLNRLNLLAAVRGLEAIEGNANVMLMSQNRYLIRSLSDSLPRWRANDFCWDHFGNRMMVQNADLWRRVDHALGIHRVEACLMSRRLVSTGVSAMTSESNSGDTSARKSMSNSDSNAATRCTATPVDPAQAIASRLSADRPLVRIDRSHGNGAGSSNDRHTPAPRHAASRSQRNERGSNRSANISGDSRRAG